MKRIASLDILRGLIVVIMALDHSREFTHSAAIAFQPENLARTWPLLFFTRWITHFCAPVFAFTAGAGAYLRLRRGGSKAELSRFLLTRGLGLVALEFTAVHLVFFFQLSVAPVFLLVFWSLGVSMIALAALIHLPFRWLVAVSAGMIALHDLADRVTPESFGAWGWLWRLLHVPGALSTDPLVIVAYPLVPWIGVMSAGYCFGRCFDVPEERRRRLLIAGGLVLTAAFVALRLGNVYGDPRPWTAQARGGVFTLLSFLNTSKYPPSLLFLLMTLGPAITLLGAVDRLRPSRWNPLLVFGRTPFLFFMLHIAAIHAIQIGLTWWRYGRAPFLFLPPPTIGTPAALFPPDFGWTLTTTYVVWLAVVGLMYPICFWFARVRERRRGWWVSYL